jgi:hypothetical protein
MNIDYEKVILYYLLAVKVITTVRDALDKTPQTDDNLVERIVTLLQKVGSALLTGQRPK